LFLNNKRNTFLERIRIIVLKNRRAGRQGNESYPLFFKGLLESNYLM